MYMIHTYLSLSIHLASPRRYGQPDEQAGPTGKPAAQPIGDYMDVHTII